MMDKLTFYMQLCFYLMDKYCGNSLVISPEEFSKVAGKNCVIKHRMHNGNLEVVATEEAE
jgi:hypothetical protein